MSEIGLGQFIKNAFNYSVGKPPTQQSAPSTNENFQQMQQEAVRQVQNTLQNIQNNFMQQVDIMNTQMQLKELNSFEKLLMLKEFFNFPKDLKEFLETFVKTSPNQVLSSQDMALLMNKNIDISKLLMLLQANGKTAGEKLAKLISTLNQSGIYNTQQLKEMTALINACIPAADASQTQLLKTLFLMYLPWLPLAPEKSNLDIGYEEDESKSGASENIVTIIITTRNYGLIKAVLYQDKSEFVLEMNCSESFPRKEFQEAVKSEPIGLNAETGISFTTRKPSENEEKNEEANITFSKSSKLSPNLLMLIHKIINLVMGFDRKADLIAQRSEI